MQRIGSENDFFLSVGSLNFFSFIFISRETGKKYKTYLRLLLLIPMSGVKTSADETKRHRLRNKDLLEKVEKTRSIEFEGKDRQDHFLCPSAAAKKSVGKA